MYVFQVQYEAGIEKGIKYIRAENLSQAESIAGNLIHSTNEAPCVFIVIARVCKLDN